MVDNRKDEQTTVIVVSNGAAYLDSEQHIQSLLTAHNGRVQRVEKVQQHLCALRLRCVDLRRLSVRELPAVRPSHLPQHLCGLLNVDLVVSTQFELLQRLQGLGLVVQQLCHRALALFGVGYCRLDFRNLQNDWERQYYESFQLKRLPFFC